MAVRIKVQAEDGRLTEYVVPTSSGWKQGDIVRMYPDGRMELVGGPRLENYSHQVARNSKDSLN